MLPAAASAGWFPAAANPPVDGPSPDIVQVGGLDLARDGTGGVVYLKKVDGVPHVFLSRFNGGVFRAPERVDNGVGAGASDAVIAAADAGRLAIAWTTGSRVYGSVVAGNGPAGPLLGPTELFNDPSGATSDPAIDMGINGTAYATWAAPGGGGADVRVARLQDVAWQTIGVPIDVDPGARRRPRRAALARGGLRRRQRAGGVGRGQRGRAPARVGAPGDRARPSRPSRRSSRCPASAAPPAERPTRSTSTWRTTAGSAGPSSARTSAAARARSGGGCSA